MIRIILQIPLKKLPDCRLALIGKVIPRGLCFINDAADCVDCPIITAKEQAVV